MFAYNMLVKFHQATTENMTHGNAQHDHRRVYTHIFIHQNANHFRSRQGLCLSLCSTLGHASFPLGCDSLRFSDMPGERFPQEMWCINEKLWLHRSELSTYIICKRPPLMHLTRARGRSEISWISGPCGSIGRLDLASSSLTLIVITLLQQSHINGWGAVQVCLSLVCCSNLLQSETSKNKRGTSFTSHYPVLKEAATVLMVTLQGRLQEGKHQITLMWTVGRSLWVGSSQMVESCLWCV